MSLVGRSRSPVSDQHLPSWQRDLILKKRAMNRMFPRLYSQVVENGSISSSNGDDSVGAFHPDSGPASSAMSIHAPSLRNNKLNNESDANGAFTPKESNWNDVRQQQQHTNPKQAEKLSEPSATQAAQQPPSFVLSKQSRFGAGSAYFAFNGAKMGKDNALTNNNNALNGFSDVGHRGEFNRMVSNGTAVDDGDEQTHGYESLENGEEFEYGPGIVNRLRSKFNSMTMREGELNSQVSSALLSPVRRVASLEDLLDMDDEDSCVPMYRSPVMRYGQRSSTLPVRSSMELMKRARSMETLTSIDRGPGVVVSASSIFGPRATFRSISREDGFPLSPINDKVIIIEQVKPSPPPPPKMPPKMNGASPGGQESKLGAGRVGQDLAWKSGTNTMLIDEELPPMNTVRKTKQLFENELQSTPTATSKTIIIRTRKLTPPPKPPGLKPGPKPPMKVKPPPSPTLVSLVPAPTQTKKVFAYLQQKELAERNDLAVEAMPQRAVSPPKLPSTAPPSVITLVPVPHSETTTEQHTTVSIVGETFKHSANFSQRAESEAPLHNGCDATAAHHHKVEAAVAHHPKVDHHNTETVVAQHHKVETVAAHHQKTETVAAHPNKTPILAAHPNKAETVAVHPIKAETVAIHPIKAETVAVHLNKAETVAVHLNKAETVAVHPNKAEIVSAHPHKVEPVTAPTKPVGAIKPFSQNQVAVAEQRPGGTTSVAETKPPPAIGKLVSSGNTGINSVLYNFIGSNVTPSIGNGSHSKPAFGDSEEVIDEDEFCVDGLLAKPLTVDFVGDNVIVGRSALMKTRNKKLKLVFDDKALSTYEYPSESSLLDGEIEDTTTSHVGEEHSSSQNAIKVRASIEMGPSVLKSTPAIGSSLGGLSSYTPMVVGSTEVFELGVSRAPPPPPAPSKSEVEKDDGEDSLFLKPAADDDNVLWSNAATSDILF